MQAIVDAGALTPIMHVTPLIDISDGNVKINEGFGPSACPVVKLKV